MRIFFMLLLFTAITAAQGQKDSVVVYEGTWSYDAAPDFRVFVNDQETFVYDSPATPFASFAFEGVVSVRIETTYDVKWVDMRPLSDDIKVYYDDNVVTFNLDEPGQWSIELNGLMQRPLLLFANPLETERPNPEAEGVLYFTAGHPHDVGKLTLHDNETVYIEAGAVVQGYIEVDDAKNVKILGRGVLDGQGRIRKNGRMIKMVNCSNVIIEGVTILDSPGWTVEPHYCDNVTLSNIKIVNHGYGTDGIDIVSSENVKIIDSFIKANDDCIVIKSFIRGDIDADAPAARDILVEDCVIWNMPWGNGLEIGFELRSDVVERITFTDIDIIRVEKGAAISIHNGDFAVVHDITYSDIRIEEAQHKLFDLAVFYSQYSRDRFPDPADRTANYLHGVWDGVQKVDQNEIEKYAANRGHIRNITFENIAIVSGGMPFSIFSGYDNGHKVEDITVSNLTFHGRPLTTLDEARFYLENTSSIIIE